MKAGEPSAAPARLFTGWVMHARQRPVKHHFRYPVFFVSLDIARLPVSHWWFGVNQPAIVSFQSRNHGDGSGDLLRWARALLQGHGLDHVDGRIELQCFPRVLGYHFKPVSFWYCHNAAGELCVVLAEVNNTFGERHVYLLQDDRGGAINRDSTLQAQKVLHVSPFCEVRGHYRFSFDVTADTRCVRLDYYDEQGLLLATSMQGHAQALECRAVLRTFITFPWQSLSIIMRIHWQAMLLFLKRVPWFAKPDAPKEEPGS